MDPTRSKKRKPRSTPLIHNTPDADARHETLGQSADGRRTKAKIVHVPLSPIRTTSQLNQIDDAYDDGWYTGEAFGAADSDGIPTMQEVNRSKVIAKPAKRYKNSVSQCLVFFMASI
jgi:hypothetical protein